MMPVADLLIMAAVLCLVLALVLQPVLQRRREDALFRQMKDARDAAEAKALADSAFQSRSRREGFDPRRLGL